MVDFVLERAFCAGGGMGGEGRASVSYRPRSKSKENKGGVHGKKKFCPCPLHSNASLSPDPSIFTSRGITSEAASKHWSPGPRAAFSHEGAPANSTAAAATIVGRRRENPSALRRKSVFVAVVAFSE